MRLRGLVSIMLMVIFVIVSVTGVIIHLTPHTGQRSYGSNVGEQASGTSKAEENRVADQPGRPGNYNFVLIRLHEGAGYLFIILGVAHLVINRKSILRSADRGDGTTL